MHTTVERRIFEILAADQVRDGIGNFADIKTQNDLDAHFEGVELLILDNLSSLTSVIRDNDAESWNPILRPCRAPCRQGRCPTRH
jgi:hypothetical protein